MMPLLPASLPWQMVIAKHLYSWPSRMTAVWLMLGLCCVNILEERTSVATTFQDVSYLLRAVSQWTLISLQLLCPWNSSFDIFCILYLGTWTAQLTPCRLGGVFHITLWQGFNAVVEPLLSVSPCLAWARCKALCKKWGSVSSSAAGGVTSYETVKMTEISKQWEHCLSRQSFLIFSWDRVSLCSPDWSWTHDDLRQSPKCWDNSHASPCLAQHKAF